MHRSGRTYFNVPKHHFTKGRKANPRSGLRTSGPKIEPGISRVRSKTGNHATVGPNSAKGMSIYVRLDHRKSLTCATILHPLPAIWMELAVET
jgi:hypothetical protein